VYDDKNVFAKIISREIPATIVLENDVALAFKDINPQADVHVLIIPKFPCIDFEEFLAKSGEDFKKFFNFVSEVAKQLGITDYRLITNKGKGAGQEVFHFHLHMLSGNIRDGMWSKN
jgi:histidine triad (HIT) family protein